MFSKQNRDYDKNNTAHLAGHLCNSPSNLLLMLHPAFALMPAVKRNYHQILTHNPYLMRLIFSKKQEKVISDVNLIETTKKAER